MDRKRVIRSTIHEPKFDHVASMDCRSGSHRRTRMSEGPFILKAKWIFVHLPLRFDLEDVGCSSVKASPSTKPASREPVEARHLHGHGPHGLHGPMCRGAGAWIQKLPSIASPCRFHGPSLGSAASALGIWAAPKLRRLGSRRSGLGSVLRRSAQGPWPENQPGESKCSLCTNRSRRGCGCLQAQN